MLYEIGFFPSGMGEEEEKQEEKNYKIIHS